MPSRRTEGFEYRFQLLLEFPLLVGPLLGELGGARLMASGGWRFLYSMTRASGSEDPLRHRSRISRVPSDAIIDRLVPSVLAGRHYHPDASIVGHLQLPSTLLGPLGQAPVPLERLLHLKTVQSRVRASVPAWPGQPDGGKQHSD